MKKNINNIAGLAAVVAFSFLLNACKYDVKGLTEAPKATFTVTPLSGVPNKYVLTSTSQNAFRYDWDKASGSFATGKQVDTVYFPYMGTYTIGLRVFGQGGMDETSAPIVVAANDPTACQGTQLGFITSCTSKKWKLDPAAAAYKVGPGPNDGSWWSSGAGDVTGRACEFNDEYTFTFSAARTFNYDNKGDFYGDGYLGDNSHTCQPSANYTSAQAGWGTGSFTYTFVPNAGVAGLGQLTVTGHGAHIGLQKVRNGGEVTSGPASAITYDVLAMTPMGGYDLLTVGVAIGGGGWWTFRLRSF